MNNFVGLLILVFISGCSAPPKGFWDGIDAKKNDALFFTGRYIGSETGCFPPLTNRRCVPMHRNEVLYQAEKQLDMESFTFSGGYSDFFVSSRVKDMLFLAASEVALQRGFSMFTLLTEMETSSCRSGGLDAITSGTFFPDPVTGSGGYYSGSTTVRRTDTCAFHKSITVLYFKDKSDLATGILRRTNSAENKDLYPETSLYLGVIPNLEQGNYNGQPAPGSFVKTPTEAWKTHYDAKGLAEDLRAKYGVTDKSSIQFRDEFLSKQKREANDPVSRRRIVSP